MHEQSEQNNSLNKGDIATKQVIAYDDGSSLC